MRHVRLVCLSLGLLVTLPLLGGLQPACAADDPVPTRTPAPRNLDDLKTKVDELVDRIEKLLEAAQSDPAEQWISIFLKYTPKEMKDAKKRKVRAEDLVDYMVDKKKDFRTVREKAKEALLGARWRGDPDLSDSEKKGRQTKRGWFAHRKLRPWLKEDKETDSVGRQLVHDTLTGMYGQAARTHAEIRKYDAKKPATWGPAFKAWDSYLKKR